MIETQPNEEKNRIEASKFRYFVSEKFAIRIFDSCKAVRASIGGLGLCTPLLKRRRGSTGAVHPPKRIQGSRLLSHVHSFAAKLSAPPLKVFWLDPRLLQRY